MKEFILQNFNKATIKSMEVGEDATDFFHRLITGFPLWKTGISSGELTAAKNDVEYPVFPSLKLNTLTLSATYGKINSYSYPLTQTGKGDLYVITTKGNVLGIDNTGVITNFGQPFAADDLVVDMASFAGKIVAVPPNDSVFWYKNEDNTGVWTSTGSLTSCRLAETFANWLLIGDKSGGIFARLDRIRIFNASWVEQTPAFDVGQTVEIVDFRNINDTYVAIIVKSSTGGQYSVYVWDGTPGNSYFKSVPLIGTYKGMVKIGNNWFILTDFMGQINVYAYNGLSVELKKEILGVQMVSSGFLVYKPRIANLGNYIVIPARITGETPYHLLFYNVVNDELFLSKVSALADFGKGLVSVWYYANNYNYLILFTDTETVVNSILLSTGQSPSYYFGATPTGQYQSNWLNLGNVQINDIEVFYDGKPDTGGSVALTLETKNEYNRTDYASASIGSITNSDENHRKIFRNIGKECNKFRITLDITHGGTNNWSGAVKKIIISYTPIKRIK